MTTLAETKLAVYASAGADLTHYEVNIDDAALIRRGTVRLPAMVQYAWQHTSRRYLYVASGNRGPGMSGTMHHVTALRIDPASGSLQAHGMPVPLPARPIHITTDFPSAHALIAYNNPSSLTVHRIDADGGIGPEVKQAVPPDAGIYGHQVRVAPSGRTVIMVARGNDAVAGRAEDPGALKVFDFRDGLLTLRATVAPQGGYGFGPRHLDFHPTQPWLYVSLERQNELCVFSMRGDTVAPSPLFRKSTLVEPGKLRGRQLAGTVHVHPNGRFVYVANRAYGFTEVQGQRLWSGGENNLAVYAIDPATGEPMLTQNIDTEGFGARTFAIDPSGRILVAGNLMPLAVRDGAGLRSIPASLVMFRIGGDGRLTFVRKYDVETGSETLFWSGMAELPDAAGG